MLLRLARAALEAHVVYGDAFDIARFKLSPRLTQRHGAFVTLRKHGELRGCMGYTSNTQALATAACRSAIRSASEDPRFNPVMPQEVRDLRIEVSALGHGDTSYTPFCRVEDPSEIALGRDGIMIRTKENRVGLLLPQMAEEHAFDIDMFLDAVCKNAGLSGAAWRDGSAEIYRFTAQVFRELD